jgi:hypothetical protein
LNGWRSALANAQAGCITAMTNLPSNALPPALRTLLKQNNWVAWKFVGGRKVPLQPHTPSQYASPSDPATWGTYSEARANGRRIGFVLLESGIGALDLDDCRNPRTSMLTRWAQRLVERSRTYCEITPSNRGLRIIGLTTGAPVHLILKRVPGQLEVYRDCPRYITVTGEQYGSCSRLRNIDWLIDELVPPSITAKDAHRAIGRFDTVAGDWRAILGRYRLRSLSLYVRVPAAQGRRSDVIWKLGRSLADRGAKPAEIAAVLIASKAWQSKHGDNLRALEREISRFFSKITA